MSARRFALCAACVSTVISITACGANSGDGVARLPAVTANRAATAGNDNRAKIVLVGTGWSSPQFTAADQNGSVYVADAGAEVVRVSPPFTGRTHGKIKIIVKDSVVGVAVDNHENVYYSSGGIWQITSRGIKNAVCPDYPSEAFFGIAVDTNEDVYAAGWKGGSTGGGQLYFIAHKAKGGWKAPAPFGPTFVGLNATGVAVDQRGNAYASLNNDVKKVEPSGKVVAVGSGFQGPYGVAVAVDCKGACSVYVADSGNNAIKKVSPPFTGPTHGKITEVGYGFLGPLGVAARNGDAYVADTGNAQVKEVLP